MGALFITVLNENFYAILVTGIFYKLKDGKVRIWNTMQV